MPTSQVRACALALLAAASLAAANRPEPIAVVGSHEGQSPALGKAAPLSSPGSVEEKRGRIRWHADILEKEEEKRMFQAAMRSVPDLERMATAKRMVKLQARLKKNVLLEHKMRERVDKLDKMMLKARQDLMNGVCRNEKECMSQLVEAEREHERLLERLRARAKFALVGREALRSKLRELSFHMQSIRDDDDDDDELHFLKE